MLKINFIKSLKKSDCQIEGFHLHKYEKSGMIRYLPRENLSFQGYDWTNDVRFVRENDQEVVNFYEKKKLLRIKDNIDFIKKQQRTLHDYREYEYEYVHFILVGKVLVPRFDTDWTSKPTNEDLTGETRICHHMFYGYKIVKENGILHLEKSPLVDDLLEIKDEYPYFKEKYIEKVYFEDKQKQFKKKN